MPIMLPVMLIMLLGYNELLNKRNSIKVSLLSIFIVCMLYGGGTLTFVLRSNSSWYWHNNAVTNINESIKRNIGPLITGYKQR